MRASVGELDFVIVVNPRLDSAYENIAKTGGRCLGLAMFTIRHAPRNRAGKVAAAVTAAATL